MRFTFAAAICALLPCSSIAALVVLVPPLADTSLSENYPSNNLGAVPFIIAGTTQNNTRNRALLSFDLTNALAGPAKVIAAELILEVVGEPNEPPQFSDFALHRVLRSWGEGSKQSPQNCVSCRGQGAPATSGEATWNSPLAFTANSWDAPGAAPMTDYDAAVSSSTTVYGFAGSPYVFPSNARMVTDVQSWLDAPAMNFGWLLASASEGTIFTARRFGAREDGLNSPQLRVTVLYLPVLRIARLPSGLVGLSFVGHEAHEYEIQRLLPGETNWIGVENIGPLAEATLVSRDYATGSEFSLSRVLVR